MEIFLYLLAVAPLILPVLLAYSLLNQRQRKSIFGHTSKRRWRTRFAPPTAATKAMRSYRMPTTKIKFQMAH